MFKVFKHFQLSTTFFLGDGSPVRPHAGAGSLSQTDQRHDPLLPGLGECGGGGAGPRGQGDGQDQGTERS